MVSVATAAGLNLFADRSAARSIHLVCLSVSSCSLALVRYNLTLLNGERRVVVVLLLLLRLLQLQLRRRRRLNIGQTDSQLVVESNHSYREFHCSCVWEERKKAPNLLIESQFRLV